MKFATVSASISKTLSKSMVLGAAVAVGRLGSIAGPLLAGALLVHGFGADAVPVAAMPGLIVAFCAVFTLAVARAKY